MSDTPSVARRFYEAFVARDAAAMGACYADDATFTDEAFVGLNAAEVRAMWAMLNARSKDLALTYEVLEETPTAARVYWVATYTFGQTGRFVENRIHADLTIRDDLIVAHRDRFDFWRWSRQALGAPGWLLGWTPFLQPKVQAKARAGLDAFMAKA